MIPTPHLNGKKVSVIGLGKSGTATASALLASGAVVNVWDDAETARAAAGDLVVQNPLDAGIESFDLVVWSPGIPHTHPKPHPIAIAARAANIPVVCDVNVLAQAKPNVPMLAITGTNGKSTSTTLLAHVIAAGGRKVAAGGNLGQAALSLADLDDQGRYVLELSSYQLELCPDLRIKAGVLLNITPDHLGRHGGMEGYIAAKRSLFDRLSPGGTAVFGVDDEHCRAMTDQLEAQGLNIVRISAQRVLDNGISAPNGILLDNGQAITDLTAIRRLPGRHNWQNACAVYALARADGMDAASIAAALATYPGLAHRQELIAELNGVTYINDSKATNADAVEKALVCYDNIHWILGGQSKEGGIEALRGYFPRIKHAYLIGDAAAQFAATLGKAVKFSQCGTLDQAIAAARADAQPGDVVLLSPACASWDQFNSFEHRGEVFRELVLGGGA